MVYWRCWFRIQTFEILTLKSFFGQIWVEKVKIVLPDNWHTWCLGGADSDYSGLRFLKFRPQNPFLGKLGPKKWKLSVLPENWHIWYLGGTDSASRLRLPRFRPQNPFSANLGRKIQSCSLCLEVGMQSISKMLILIPTLVFWISNTKSTFMQVWDKKVKAVRFAWKLAHTQYLEDADSFFDISFVKFQTQILRCWFLFWD